jgi:putative transposase
MTDTLTGTFGAPQIAVPHARITGECGTTDWKSKALRAYQHCARAADALVASTLIYPEPRRAESAGRLAVLFGGAACKDTVSRVWRIVKRDWDAWNARSLAEEPISRLILDGVDCARASRQEGDLDLPAGRPRR